MSTNAIVYMVPGVAICALIYGLIRIRWVLSQDPGTERMQVIGKWISDGAMAFLSREYKSLAIFVILVAILLGFSNAQVGESQNTNGLISLSFVLGAFCSALAGYIGMKSATAANMRTAAAARTGLNEALQVAFAGGSVMGLSVVGLALLGLGSLLILFLRMYPEAVHGGDPTMLVLNLLSGFSLGASSIALFARVGGGIFTKAADVGADLVGKVEEGIPEDHPLNPATIADNVGDNVGDVAGMGADLFESYIGAIVSSMILGSAWFVGLEAAKEGAGLNAILLPLLVAVIGVIASILGFFFVTTKEGGDPQKGLNRGTFAAGILMVIGMIGAIKMMVPAAGVTVIDIISGERTYQWWGIAAAVISGLISGIVIGMITEWYTATERSPVETIVNSSRTGHATTIIQGIAVGMNSTTLPVLVISGAILIAFHFAGLYGIAMAALGMLSTIAIQLATDAYGPIADNAGGVAEMSRLGRDVRARTDKLDAVGNTTAAIGKGFAIGSAALTALSLTAAFLTKMQGEVNIDAANPYVLVGLLIGCMLPFRFSAMAMLAVGNAAQDMIQEVRRQFNEIPELRPALAAANRAESEERDPTPEEAKIIRAADGKADYSHCVEIATGAAIKKMMAPGIMAVLAPIVIGFISPDMLGGLLVGVTISGVCLAIFLSNSGGAWDNAKKQVKDEGHEKWGHEHDEMHKATVTGDTVGDPFKDTAGPSLNILIKLISVVAMIIAPVLYAFHFG
ncbi:V-type H(+)-translocating pyrophosphatase [Bythopirellula goksoeyrii]|uniref:Putative K(+)-stimulated pyrophosphate-energized sodium pump n=1 Tax=Bythopirellula goksoeyrii TaxID=1400387 RepID=A0A5B9Q798_9BACT|nr:V-type H(+)-translocating pyrophosphatase [Bythopirellula goksoeyrii]QEG34857.1 Putative K(+)-stimulated pyrophosphate-energized sodium pump [Bythopirellula goksoeyrii]